MTVTRPLVAGPLAALALLGSAALAACGSTDEEIELGAVGVEAEIGDLALRDIELSNPPPGGYETGSAARLNLAIINQGLVDDYLVDVSGQAFDAVLVEDGEPGTPLRITIPAGQTVYTGSSGEPDLILVGMNESLFVSETVSVTLAFEKAGEVTVEAVVSAPLRLTLERYLREVKVGGL